MIAEGPVMVSRLRACSTMGVAARRKLGGNCAIVVAALGAEVTILCLIDLHERERGKRRC